MFRYQNLLTHIVLNSTSSISNVLENSMEIIPNIHMIDDISAHCYLIIDEELMLVDTGMPHKPKNILYYITAVLHKIPTDLKTILLTHCDIDHIENAFKLRKLTGVKIAAHPRDAEIIAEGKPG